MRVRDAQLYYLEEKGYQRVATWGDLELWADPDDPSEFTVIRACLPLSDEMTDALIEEFERMEAEDSISPGE